MPDLAHKYLRVSDLRRLRNVMFAARRPVEGRYAGRHASRQRGQSVEFSDYRPYMPGDEPGDIDWKIFARSDRLVVKLFEHQSDMTVHLLLDASASMAYSGLESRRDTDSKYDHAARLAAAIAFLVSRQQDRYAFAFARGGLHRHHKVAAGPKHLLSILDVLQSVKPRESAQLPEAIIEMARRAGRRALLIVLSDLLDETDHALRAMSRFTDRGGEVVVFHIVHPDELDLPDVDDARFTDSETGDRLSLNIPDLRDAYCRRFQQHLDACAAGCRARGFDYQRVSTAIDYHHALEHYLFSRAATV